MSLYAICVYIPEAALDAVKQAMFDAGAGSLGNSSSSSNSSNSSNYSNCAWQVLGVGQFKPLAGSAPNIGRVGSLERVAEFRVEMVCEVEVLGEVLAALRAAHPYEEPAYQYWPINAPLPDC